MRTISCKLEDLKNMVLHIGYEGENDYTSVRIDAGSVFAQYPEAVPSLKVQPPKGNMYPVIVTRDGDIVIWNVSDSDTASNGNGEIQLTFTENTVVVKSCTGKTLVHRSLKATGPAPDPLIDFIDMAEEVVEEAKDAAEAAEAAAQHAPMIGLDGYWYKWDAETEGYVKTDTKARGEDGANGVGITSVEKISTVGLVDTYRINFTNGTNTTYTVTNGQDGSVPIDDTTPAANKVFSSAKVDEELTDVKNNIQGMNTATASDVGKALSPKTVVNGEVTEWQFVGEEPAHDDVKYTTGTESGYYRLKSSSDHTIEEKTSSSFTRIKITVESWMESVKYKVESIEGFTKNTTIYCAFTDNSDTYISKSPVEVGAQEMAIPDDAKYMYLCFFGSPYLIDGYTIVSKTSEKNDSPYDGMDGVAFGTSLTYRAQSTGGYLEYLPDLSGIDFDNQSIGSATILGNGGNLDMLAAIKAYNSYSSKDVCILEGFVNDWYNNKTLGTWKDSTETTVCGCVRSALNYMLSENANMTVFLILDPYGRNYNNVDCSSTAENGSNLTQKEFYDEIAKVAESLGIPVIREYAESQISENTPQYMLDNIHPNALGARQSANFIWSRMKTYLPNAVS